MPIVGYDIRVNGQGWMPVGDVLSTVVHGLQADEHSFELRARDANGNVSDPAGPILGTALPMPEEIGDLFTKLVSAWELDESSGNALDSHGSNELTDVNTVGASGGWREFVSANNEYFSHADNTDLSMGDIDFMLAAEVQLATLSTDKMIVSKFNLSGSSREYFVRCNSSNIFDAGVSANGTSTTSLTATAFGAAEVGPLYHVLFWHDATLNTINLCINNGTVFTSTHNGGVFDGTAEFRIGEAQSPNQRWNGLIRRVRMWKGIVPNASMRAWLYNGGAGRSYSDIAALDPVPMRITTEYLSEAVVGSEYLDTLAAADAVGAVDWSIETGSLPDGLTLNPSTGEIAGEPETPGVFSAVFAAEDDNTVAYRYLTILVDEVPASFLLDNLEEEAVCAVGMRRLNGAYTGDLIRVVRPSDSAEADIGYTASGWLDRAAARTFGGSETLRVKTFYDQSGNGNDLSNDTNGPDLIYDHFGGRPGLDWGDASNSFSALSSAGNVSFTQLQGFFVVDHVNPTVEQCLSDIDTNGFLVQTGISNLQLYNGTGIDCGVFEGGKAQISIQFKSGSDGARINGMNRPGIATTTGLAGTNAGDTARNEQIFLGCRASSTGNWRGKLGEAIWFADVISNDDLNIIEASQLSAYNLAGAPAFMPPFSNRVIMEGDSRTFGFNNTGNPAPLHEPLQALLGLDWLVKNVANSAQRLIEEYTPQAAFQVDPYFNSKLLKNIVVVWGIVNDLHFDTDETLDENDLYAAMTAYIQARQAAGFEVIVCTDLPNKPSTTYITEGQHAIITAYNALVVANAAGADAVVDFSDDADLTDATDEDFFTDGTHITDAAADKCAALIAAAIEGL